MSFITVPRFLHVTENLNNEYPVKRVQGLQYPLPKVSLGKGSCDGKEMAENPQLMFMWNLTYSC